MAHDLAADRAVAVKFLRTTEQWAVQRFEVEAAALARLDHPNCLALLDYGSLGGQPFIVTDFLAGTSLSEWMASPRPNSESLDVAVQIAEAIAHAHGRQVLHRDLKPANIMISTDPDGSVRVKVLDFGMARLTGSELSDITKTGEVLGTPGYMSPEQLRAAPDIGPPTDVYSLGVIVFAMLEGHAPFVGDTHLALAMNHLMTPAPPMRAPVPPAVGQLVAAMLDKTASRRPPVRDVLRVLRGEPFRAPLDEATTRRRVIGAHAPNRAGILGVGLAVAIIAVVVAIGLANREPSAASQVVSVSSVGGVERTSSLIKQRDEPGAPSSPTTVSAADAGSLIDAQNEVVGGSDGCGRAHPSGVAEVAGAVRPVLVRTPTPYVANRPAPVLLLLHDISQRPSHMMETADLIALAERDGFVVLAPAFANAPELPIFGDLPIWGNGLAPEDVEHVRDDLEIVAAQYCLDLDRVFVIGHGNGAVTADYVACSTRGVVALATSAHRLWGSRTLCTSGAVVPTIFLAPLADPAAPIDNAPDCWGNANKWPLETHEQALRDHHGCVGKPRRAGRSCHSASCDVPLVWCRAEGGRDWKSMPSRRALTGDAATKLRSFCASTKGDFDYATTIWDFFTDVDARKRAGEQ